LSSIISLLERPPSGDPLIARTFAHSFKSLFACTEHAPEAHFFIFKIPLPRAGGLNPPRADVAHYNSLITSTSSALNIISSR
jgi:hypothetical protein